jgi:hypothetical protein
LFLYFLACCRAYTYTRFILISSHFLFFPNFPKFSDLESRLKRWRIFRHFQTTTHNRRSTSAEPQQKRRIDTGIDTKDPIRTNKSNPIFGIVESSPTSSFTCPIPRKKLQSKGNKLLEIFKNVKTDLNYTLKFNLSSKVNLSGPIRPRPKLDPVSSSSDSLSPEEVSSRFQIIQQKSGQLNINGTVFNGVEFSDLERLEQNAQLGDGAGGSVCKYKLKSRLIAVKVCADIYNKETLINLKTFEANETD